jgi:hypothetical protein
MRFDVHSLRLTGTVFDRIKHLPMAFNEAAIKPPFPATLRHIVYRSTIAPATVPQFLRLTRSNITSTITNLRAGTTVSARSCRIACSERCSDDAMQARIAPGPQAQKTQCVRWIWTCCATFGNKATKFGTSFGRKSPATTEAIESRGR